MHTAPRQGGEYGGHVVQRPQVQACVEGQWEGSSQGREDEGEGERQMGVWCVEKEEDAVHDPLRLLAAGTVPVMGLGRLGLGTQA